MRASTDLATTPPRTTPPERADPAAPPEAPVVHIEDARLSAWASVRAVWHYRGWLPWLGSDVLIRKIAGTKLGWLWLVIRPLMDSVGKALIFGGLLQVGAPNGVPYFVFMMVGMVAWRLFDRFVYYAARSFDIYSKLMKTFNFPLLLVPLAAGAYPAVEVGVYVLVLIGAVGFYAATDGVVYIQFSPVTLVSLVGFALMILIAWGISLWVSVLNGKARDTRLLIRYVLEIWLYVTPVVYPLTSLPPAFKALAALNPLTAPVELVKLGLIGAGRVESLPLAWSCAFAALMILSGLWFFNREASRSIGLHGPGGDDEEDDL